jgi:hypothetical protein
MVWVGAVPTGSTPSAPSITLAEGADGTELFVVVRGNDGKIYSTKKDLSTLAWSAWSLMPGSSPSPPAVAGYIY